MSEPRDGGRDEVRALLREVTAQVALAVVGQERVVRLAVGALLVGGHVLLEGVPGTAKTLLAQAVARALDLDFRRVQFTPDLLPGDLTGTVVLRAGRLEFAPGPVFTSVLLGDEINRTPPKTQAALLEAMQEGQVSVDGQTYALPEPFLVLATQNPLDHEGTYPLPEAQLDRFHVRAQVGYPSAESELAMLATAHRGVLATSLDAITPVAGPQRIAAAAAIVQATRADEPVKRYLVEVVRATREVPAVAIGASPRAAVHLLAAARAEARLSGRAFVTPDDVAAVLEPVLGHRIVLRAEAELERYPVRAALEAALAAVPVPRLPAGGAPAAAGYPGAAAGRSPGPG